MNFNNLTQSQKESVFSKQNLWIPAKYYVLSCEKINYPVEKKDDGYIIVPPRNNNGEMTKGAFRLFWKDNPLKINKSLTKIMATVGGIQITVANGEKRTFWSEIRTSAMPIELTLANGCITDVTFPFYDDVKGDYNELNRFKRLFEADKLFYSSVS